MPNSLGVFSYLLKQCFTLSSIAQSIEFAHSCAVLGTYQGLLSYNIKTCVLTKDYKFA